MRSAGKNPRSWLLRHNEPSVDIETRPTGTFARVSTTTPTWLDQNRRTVVRASVIGAALLFVGIAGSIWASNQSQHAQDAFSNAMDVYDSPLQQAGQPPIPNVKWYSSAAARAKEANPLFREVAGKYGWLKAGGNAEYFAGLTDEDMGRTADAEEELKKAAGNSDAGLAALAKMALASLYSGSGRQKDAAGLYRGLIDHPTLTVSANAARLALAEAEASTNPQEARELYAKVKDTDKTTAAGQIAAQKLSGK